MYESIIRVLPPPTVLPTRFQYYCTTIVQCTIPPRPPLCLLYTINIGMTISCAGQMLNCSFRPASVWRQTAQSGMSTYIISMYCSSKPRVNEESYRLAPLSFYRIWSSCRPASVWRADGAKRHVHIQVDRRGHQSVVLERGLEHREAERHVGRMPGERS